jgi:hypothetical protein
MIQLSDEDFISYQISFSEANGTISGYSITDMGGPHETKSFISGYFSDTDNTLEFYESGILYTKSFVNQKDFCYAHFDGKLKKLNERQHIEGSFQGLYDNGEKCISGEIKLASFGRMLRKAQKLDKRIDRNPLVSKEQKEKVNLVQALDSLTMNLISNNEKLSVFTENEAVTLELFDAGQEDGDRISIYVDGSIFLNNYTVTTAPKSIVIPTLKDKTLVKIVALNNGTIGGNTVRLNLVDKGNSIELTTNFQKNESAEFIFLKREK